MALLKKPGGVYILSISGRKVGKYVGGKTSMRRQKKRTVEWRSASYSDASLFPTACWLSHIRVKNVHDLSQFMIKFTLSVPSHHEPAMRATSDRFS